MVKGKKKVEEVETPKIKEDFLTAEKEIEVVIKETPVIKKKVYAVSDKFYAEDGMVINKNGVPVSKVIGQAEAEKVASRFNK